MESDHLILYIDTDLERQCKVCRVTYTLKNFERHHGCQYDKRFTCCHCRRKYHNTFDGFMRKLFGDSIHSSKRRTGKGRTLAGEHTIKTEDLKAIWNRQNGKCFYSGISMSTKKNSDWMCSIERVDSQKGYVHDNVVLVCYEFNGMIQWSTSKVVSVKERLLSPPCSIFDTVVKDLLSDGHPNHKCEIIFVHGNNKGKRCCDVHEQCNNVRHRKIRQNEGIKCSLCNVIKPRDQYRKKISSGCTDCCSRFSDKYQKYTCTPKGRLYRTLYHAREHTLMRNSKNRQKTECTLTHDDLVELLVSQRGKCFYSGIEMTYGMAKTDDWVISLERINPIRGYSKDNICFICAEFNGMDHTAKSKYFNGGSGAWSKSKFKVFESILINKTEIKE